MARLISSTVCCGWAAHRSIADMAIIAVAGTWYGAGTRIRPRQVVPQPRHRDVIVDCFGQLVFGLELAGRIAQQCGKIRDPVEVVAVAPAPRRNGRRHVSGGKSPGGCLTASSASRRAGPFAATQSRVGSSAYCQPSAAVSLADSSFTRGRGVSADTASTKSDRLVGCTSKLGCGVPCCTSSGRVTGGICVTRQTTIVPAITDNGTTRLEPRATPGRQRIAIDEPISRPHPTGKQKDQRQDAERPPGDQLQPRGA